ncbi:transposase family protein [Acidiphilium sp. AL]|nr:transposase family protein [Acidiphilium sp. AL]
MSPHPAPLSDKSRLAVLLEHFVTIDDPRDVRRISHPLAEILLLVVCGTIADCLEADPVSGSRSSGRRGRARLPGRPRHDLTRRQAQAGATPQRRKPAALKLR